MDCWSNENGALDRWIDELGSLRLPMPSAFSHGFVALIGGKIFAKTNSFTFCFLSLLCSVIPDAGRRHIKFGMPYSSMLDFTKYFFTFRPIKVSPISVLGFIQND